MKKFGQFVTVRKQADDEKYMRLALELAANAAKNGDNSIGAVLVWSNGVTLSEHDTTFTENCRTRHAEMNVLDKALVLNRPLADATLYVTVEPCVMCAMAAHFNGVREVVFGAYDTKYGFTSSKMLNETAMLNIAVKGGVLAGECRNLLPECCHEFIVEHL